MKKSLWLIASIIILALSRVIPHVPNFTPVLACALFAGAIFENKKIGSLTLLISLLLSDILLEMVYGYGFHSLMIPIYLTILFINRIGVKLQDRISTKNIALFSIMNSSIFFILSNLFVFLQGGYGYTFEGFISCYVMALPFYNYQILGDVFYNFIIFGSYFFIFENYLVKKKV